MDARRRFTIGIDFGTLSGRAILVDVATGEEAATAVYEYENGVIDEVLPVGGPPLPPDFALQDPADYVRTVERTIPELLRTSGARPEQVVGVGIDFTSCTMLPARADGTPLCFLPEFRPNPHAWVKLWKHHAAQDHANRLNAIARRRGEPWLPRYGGKISSEWFFPKVWQILEEAPEVYAAADRLLEAADWVVWHLTGHETRNSTTAGYKAIWSKREGFPSRDFFAALDPRLADVVDQKMSRRILPQGSLAGGLRAEVAERIGLLPGTAVAVGNVDAHVAVPATTVVSPHKMVMVMGTSICHMVLDREEHMVEGMCGVVEDGILPGLFGYEAGQSAVGDIFAWYVEQGIPAEYQEQARRRGIGPHELLEEKASRLKPGESGLLALDWWNGNRSVLVDVDLTGMMVGMTLATRPEEIYRALIEGTAFGTRLIMDAFERHGVPIEEVVACGGLPDRNRLLMQIYADVTGREFRVARSSNTSALGSAMFAAVAAGAARGGYDDIVTAAARMAGVRDQVYRPDAESHRIYTELYREYQLLHDYFGRGANDVMKRLKALRARYRASTVRAC
ncbi:ribulokinase [Carboxydochorda subterranea]|uniref:Ribulokinase n=1 Tax=Carboxydichorda subterranea TaxID=3109565 RepID=A0ABZ1BX15_9FIRM|nr:ribulokinase [Limnochorda sp. L945t]WRP17322.1 ribulokinase [Limnochorda sp. L945t]